MNGKAPLWMIGAVVVVLALLVGGVATTLSITDRWATKTEVAALAAQVAAVARDVREIRDALAPLPARPRRSEVP